MGWFFTTGGGGGIKERFAPMMFGTCYKLMLSTYRDPSLFFYYRAQHITSAILEKDRALMQKEEEVGN